MVEVAPFTPKHEVQALQLMMRCIKEKKRRKFDPKHDEDMLDLARYYDPHCDSLLLLVLVEDVMERCRKKVVGTLGLKHEGNVRGKKTGTLKRLYVESEHRTEALVPLFRTMRRWVIDNDFQTLRFIGRKRMGRIFDTYSRIASLFGMETEEIDSESLLFTWSLQRK